MSDAGKAQSHLSSMFTKLLKGKLLIIYLHLGLCCLFLSLGAAPMTRTGAVAVPHPFLATLCYLGATCFWLLALCTFLFGDGEMPI